VKKDLRLTDIRGSRRYTSRQEPPFFLGCSVALALRHALKSARLDAGIPLSDVQEFRFPLTSERLRMAVGDDLAKRAEVKQKEGEAGFFVYI
jgi:xanthine dehydrogenase/oxidase